MVTNNGKGTAPVASENSFNKLQQCLQRLVITCYNTPAIRKNEVVFKALDELSAAMGVDRCNFALIDEEKEHLAWIGEGVNQGVLPNYAFDRKLITDAYDYLYASLSKNDYIAIQDLESELHDSAVVVKDFFRNYGYCSFLFVAVKKEGVLTGWIGFGNKSSPITYRSEHIETIKAIGAFLYTDITRYNSLKSLKIFSEILEEAEQLAQIGSWEFDLYAKKLKTSTYFEKLIGLSLKQNKHSLNRLIRHFGIKNWRSIKAHLIQLFNEENESFSTFEIRLGEGKNSKYFKVRSKIHRSLKGKPYKLSGIVHDITTQKLADEKLEMALTQQNIICKYIKEYICLYKVEGEGKYIIESCNDSFVELQRWFAEGLTKEDILGRDLSEYARNAIYLHKDRISEMLNTLNQVVKSQRDFVKDEEITRPDGSKLFIQSTFSPIIENGEVKYLMWSGHDFTKLHLTQKQLLEKEQEFKLALKASRLGFYKWDVSKDCVFLDGGYSQMLGLGDKPCTVSTSVLKKRIVDKYYAEITAKLDACMASSENSSFFESELEYYTQEGAKRIFISALFLRSPEYPMGLLLGFAQDITDQKLAEERLKESEARWRALHETASDAIFIVENDIIVDCNIAALDVFGCSDKSEMIGRTPWFFSPELQSEGISSKEKGWAYIQQAIQGEKTKFSWIHKKADGTLFEAEVSLSAIRSQGRTLVQGIIRDVTEKMQFIRALRESEEKYRSLVESSLQGILFLVDGKVRYFNRTLTELLGYNSDEIYRMTPANFMELIHDQDLVELVELKSMNFAKPMSMEVRIRRKDGSYRWVKCRIGKLSYTEHNSIVITFIDITEQIKAHEIALQSAIESEDRERQRIAAELHDGLGQLLSSAALNLGAIKESIATLSPKTVANYQTAMENLRQAMAETRTISHNLMPKAIKDFGYAMAVEQLIYSTNEVSDVHFSFFTNFREGRLSPILERNLYRITQEAITNIVKHSKAHSGVVQMMKYPEMILLTIEDDGIGFDLASVDTANHIGIKNIRNRAETIGAMLNIDTSPNHGTIITLQIPLIHE